MGSPVQSGLTLLTLPSAHYCCLVSCFLLVSLTILARRDCVASVIHRQAMCSPWRLTKDQRMNHSLTLFLGKLRFNRVYQVCKQRDKYMSDSGTCRASSLPALCDTGTFLAYPSLSSALLPPSVSPRVAKKRRKEISRAALSWAHRAHSNFCLRAADGRSFLWG